jgi:hypothetical protein
VQRAVRKEGIKVQIASERVARGARGRKAMLEMQGSKKRSGNTKSFKVAC